LRLISGEENLARKRSIDWALVKEHQLFDILPKETKENLWQ
jgi:hypothetical protein